MNYSLTHEGFVIPTSVVMRPYERKDMLEKMHTLYVIRNKGYHYALLEHLTGDNPLKEKFIEAWFVFCPEDPTENHVILSDDELYTPGGYLTDYYIGRTHFLY